MHRNCRAITVFRNQCKCRGLSTASAVQFKKTTERNDEPSSSNPTPVKLPSAKSWAVPPPNRTVDKPQRRPSQVGAPPPKSWTASPPRPAPSRASNANATERTPSTSSSMARSLPPHRESKWSTSPRAPSSIEHRRQHLTQQPSAQILPEAPQQHSPLSRQPPESPAPSQNMPRSERRAPRRAAERSQLQPASSETRRPSNSQRPMDSNSESRPSSRFLPERAPQADSWTNNTRSSSSSDQGQAPPTKSITPRPKPSTTELKTFVNPRKSMRKRKSVFIPKTLTVSSLASILGVKLPHLQRTMKRVGMAEEAHYDYILTADYAILLAEEMNFNAVVDDEAAFDILPPPPHPNYSSLPHRPPVVTIMGHVDHGKTTLLDTLRSASVAKGEAGGITQHIGAFSVPVKTSSPDGPQTITFLDTPGHAAFSAMRARGADVTDIVVLVVAADDGIMPQTKEVINLLKKEDSKISLVVAINKVDKPGVDTDAVKLALMAEGVQLEEFGGDIPAVHVSGLTGEGLPELVETLSMVAEMQDLRAEQDGSVYGHVLESNIHKGLGSVATVLITRGCLEPGALVIAGLSQGRVRLMKDSNGALIKKALPGMAVTVSGWKTLPNAGDEVLTGTESDIKKALTNREKQLENQAQQQDIEAINTARLLERNARAEGIDTASLPGAATSGPKELKLIIKTDVSGSGEAVKGALDAMGNKIAVSKVISTAVGDITESDVTLAKAANATLVGFSVSVTRSVRNLAAQSNVPIFTSDIIYRLVDNVRASLIDMLPKIIETKVSGEANVQQLFDIQVKGGKSMKVAGCRVINGLVEKNKRARVIRGGETVHEGMFDTMRQLRSDVTEARKGVECGLSFQEFSDLREGDLIQTIEIIEKPGIL